MYGIRGIRTFPYVRNPWNPNKGNRGEAPQHILIEVMKTARCHGIDNRLKASGARIELGRKRDGGMRDAFMIVQQSCSLQPIGILSKIISKLIVLITQCVQLSSVLFQIFLCHIEFRPTIQLPQFVIDIIDEIHV